MVLVYNLIVKKLILYGLKKELQELKKIVTESINGETYLKAIKKSLIPHKGFNKIYIHFLIYCIYNYT